MDKAKSNLVLLHGGASKRCKCGYLYPKDVRFDMTYERGTFITGLYKYLTIYSCPVCKRQVTMDDTVKFAPWFKNNGDIDRLYGLSINEKVSFAKKILAENPEPSHWDKHYMKYCYAYMVLVLLIVSLGTWNAFHH
jgi:hypothetical protein